MSLSKDLLKGHWKLLSILLTEKVIKWKFDMRNSTNGLPILIFNETQRKYNYFSVITGRFRLIIIQHFYFSLKKTFKTVIRLYSSHDWTLIVLYDKDLWWYCNRSENRINTNLLKSLKIRVLGVPSRKLLTYFVRFLEWVYWRMRYQKGWFESLLAI